MSKTEWITTCLLIWFAIATLALMYFQYMNRRGGRKRWVVIKSFSTAIITTLVLYFVGERQWVDEPSLRLYLGSEELRQVTTEVVYGLDVESTTRPAVVHLPLILVNEGTRTGTNVVLKINYPDDRAVPMPEKFKGSEHIPPGNTRKVSQHGSFASTEYEFASLNGSKAAAIAEPFRWSAPYLSAWATGSAAPVGVTIFVKLENEVPKKYETVLRALPLVNGKDFAIQHSALANPDAPPHDLFVVVPRFEHGEKHLSFLDFPFSYSRPENDGWTRVSVRCDGRGFFSYNCAKQMGSTPSVTDLWRPASKPK